MIQEIFKQLFKGITYLFNLIFKKRKLVMKPGEMALHKDLQEKYGLFAENKPSIKLNSKKIPADLQDLIPLAEKWGISDDIIRYDFEQKCTEIDKSELKEKLSGRLDKINGWLDSFNEQKEMTEEAAAFMYMTLAFDEMQLYEPTHPDTH